MACLSDIYVNFCKWEGGRNERGMTREETNERDKKTIREEREVD
jgi:hypothetical protein